MKRILIIEDDGDIRDGLSELLTLEGFEVELASDGQRGIDYLRATPQTPDVILLDLIMPVKDGYQFRDEQLADQRLSKIPVVIMTANRTQDIKSLGTKGFLRKPVSIDDLLSVIGRASA